MNFTNNLTFLERFNSGLGSWTLDQTGGTVTIVTQDFSSKLKLNDTGAGIVSAVRSFSAPTSLFILEFDAYWATGAAFIAELLDASNNVIMTMRGGLTANTFGFFTDAAAESTKAWTAGLYKEVIVVINPAGPTATCYISEDDNTYGSLQIVGAAKSYSGATIAKIRFKTDTTKSGIAYFDEVKVYTPDLFMIGDSITDGKVYWSRHPEYPTGRLSATSDETSSPSYKLSQRLGSSYWVANRAFGGTDTAGVNSYIQATVLDHGAQKVYIGIGHNDIMNGVALSTMESNFDSIITKILAAGIPAGNIAIGNVYPTAYLDTDLERSKRAAWNTYLFYKASSIGAVYVDNSAALTDPANENALNPVYAYTDNVHLIPAGNQVLANNIMGAILTQTYTGNNILRADIGASDERLYPQGYMLGIADTNVSARSYMARPFMPLIQTMGGL